MNEPSFDESLLATIVDEFTDRCHRGEVVDVHMYAEMHPTLASVLRQVLPAIQALANRSSELTPAETPPASGYGSLTPQTQDRHQIASDGSTRLGSGPWDRSEVPLAGTAWQEYELLKELGRGGMGLVYMARHRKLDRVVALKLLKTGLLEDADHLERFRAEARTIAKLAHPNIVQIFEVGEHEGRPFLALEYCEGGNLASKCAGEPQPPRWSAEMALKLAQAVEAAHQAGVIHRDLKPANVLLTANGTPKLVDFGLAKQTDIGQDHTVTGAILGTPSYMAPEQTQGDKKQTSPAVDVYALGAILYELLVGRPPFKGTTILETLDQVRSLEVVAPRQLVPGLPRDLETICLKCLRKDPQARYATAKEVAQDLERYIAGKPILARPVSSPERAVRWIKRNPVISGLMAAIVLSLTLGLAGMTVLYNEAQLQTQEAQDRTKEAKQNEAKAIAEEQQAIKERDEKLRRLYEARLSESRALRTSGKVGQRFDSFDRLTEAAMIAKEQGFFTEVESELRTEAIACLAVRLDVRESPNSSVKLKDTGITRILTADDRLQYYAGYSPHEKCVLVFRRSDGEVVFRSPQVTRQPEMARHVRLSRDGKRLLVHDGSKPSDEFRSNLQVWDIPSEKLLFDAPWSVAHHLRIGPAALSPDGQQVAIAKNPNQIHLFDLETGSEIKSFPCLSSPTELGFSSDGTQIACVRIAETENVATYDLGTGTATQTLSVPFGRQIVEHRLCWHPSNKFLAVLNVEGRASAAIYELETGTLISKMTNPASMVMEAGFTESGDVFYTRNNQNLARFWDPWTGRQLMELYQVRLFRGEHGLLRLSGINEMEHWELAVSQVLRTLPPQQVSPSSQSASWSVPEPNFTPDGRFVFVDQGDAATRFWDLERSESAGTIPRAPMGLNFHGTLIHPVTKELLLTSNSPDVTAWTVDWTTGKLHSPRTYINNARAKMMAVSQDGQVFISRNAKGQWLIARPEESSQPRTLLETDGFSTLGYGDRMALSHHGKRAFFGYQGSLRGAQAYIYDTESGEALMSRQVGGLFEFDPKDEWMVAPMNDSLRFHSPDTGEVIREIKSSETAYVQKRVSWTADGSILAYDFTPGHMRICEAESLRVLADIIAPNTDPTVCRMTPDGTRLVAVGDQVHVWDLRKLRTELQTIGLDWDAPPLPTASDSVPPPIWFHFDPDSLPLAEALEKNAAPVDRRPAVLKTGSLQRLAIPPRNKAYAPDGKRLTVYLGDSVGEIGEYDLATGELIRNFPYGGGWVGDMSYSPDGKWFAVGLLNDDFSVRVFDAKTAKLKHTLRGHQGRVYNVRFNQTGELLGTTNADGIVRIWSPETGELRYEISDPNHLLPERLAFHPNGKMILVSGGKTIQLREGENFETVRRVLGSVNSWSGSDFSPDGTLLAVGDDTTTLIWQIGEEDKLLATLEHTPGTYVWFTADGKQLITGSRRGDSSEPERLIKIWNIGDWSQPVKIFSTGKTGSTAQYAFFAAGNLLAFHTHGESRVQFRNIQDGRVEIGKPPSP